MTIEIAKNIFLIKIPLPNNPLRNLNSYFIKGNERNLLIDTGFNSPICYEAMTEGLKKLNVDMNLTDIFLTHLHSDHTGLCTRIASDNSKIYLSSIDAKYISTFYGEKYKNFLRNRFHSLGFSISEFEQNIIDNHAIKFAPPENAKYSEFEDACTFDLGNRVLKAVHTPGHTIGHMCLYDETDEILFSGDHVIFNISPNITAWDGVDDALGLYLESLKKTAKLKVKTTLSAHRDPIGSLSDRISELLSHHKKRLEEAYSIILNNKEMTAYDAASKMTWSIRAKDWNDFPITQKWFAVGEGKSHLDHLVAKNMLAVKEKEGKEYYYIP
jgi:glyoxylase-like metal-dependent hydrolase (beta-lactamase superfamily II)